MHYLCFIYALSMLYLCPIHTPSIPRPCLHAPSIPRPPSPIPRPPPSIPCSPLAHSLSIPHPFPVHPRPFPVHPHPFPVHPRPICWPSPIQSPADPRALPRDTTPHT